MATSREMGLAVEKGRAWRCGSAHRRPDARCHRDRGRLLACRLPLFFGIMRVEVAASGQHPSTSMVTKKKKMKKGRASQALPETNYHVLNCFAEPGDAIISELPALPDPLDNWMGGDEIALRDETPLRFAICDDDAGTMRPFYNLGIPLMDREMLEILRANGARNLQDYPAVIHDFSVGEDITNYRAVNIVGLVSMADLEGSELDDLGFGEARFFHHLAVREADTRRLLIFRLKESVNAVFIHGRLKIALEEAGFGRLDFVHPMRWSG